MRIFNHSFPFDRLINPPAVAPTREAAVVVPLRTSRQEATVAPIDGSGAAAIAPRWPGAGQSFDSLRVGGLEHYIDSRLPAGRFRID